MLDDDSVARWMAKGLLFYPQLPLGLTGAFVPCPGSKIAPQLVSRIKTAYQLAISGFKGAGDSPWSHYAERSRHIHECLIAKGNEAITRVLEDPIPTGLFYGFYGLAHDLGLDEACAEGRRLADWSTQQIFGCLIRLAEATGSIRLWNPEGTHPAPSGGLCRLSSRRCWPPSTRESESGWIFPIPFRASSACVEPRYCQLSGSSGDLSSLAHPRIAARHRRNEGA